MILLWLVGCATRTISGSIYSIEQQPLSNATCVMFEQATQSDTNGLYQFTDLHLKKGEYTIQCTHKGFQFYQDTISIEGVSATVPQIVLTPLDVQIPYLPINLDPASPITPSK